jgi:WD40 repeat protein
VTLRRRDVLRGALAIGAGSIATRAQRVWAAKVVPFAPGDIFATCTLLDDPNDDHRGRGRIIHYDTNLAIKNTLWLDDTTHLLQGPRFSPQQVLFAFDAFAYKVVRFAVDGSRLPNLVEAPARAFGSVAFAADGRFFLGETLVGTGSRLPLKTTLPTMPGSARLGDGHVFEFDSNGKSKREHATPTHGGMAGFQGVSSLALAPDGRTLVYVSETGPKIFAWDVATGTSLPDIANFPDSSRKFYFDVRFDEVGTLYALAGGTLEIYDLRSRALRRSIALSGFGWASMSTPRSGNILLANFFSGEIAKLDLATGAVLQKAQTNAPKALSGIAQLS